jgi:hypothetical protein
MLTEDGPHSNLTGVWRLRNDASDFGFLPAPRLRTDTITHNGRELRILTRQKDANGEITVERDLTIGGAEAELTIHGRTRRMRAFRDDAAIVLETRYEVSGNPRRIEDRLLPDADGQWLSIHRLLEQPGGVVRQRLRFRREP